jgi:hypothetical protein
LFYTKVRVLLNFFRLSLISCQLGAAYASTLRITIAYICLALGTLVPHAEAANLLNASICVAIFPLTLAKWVFQDSLLLSHTFKNRASIMGRTITAPKRKSSLHLKQAAATI